MATISPFFLLGRNNVYSTVILGSGLGGGRVKWQQHCELASRPDDAMDFDAPMVLFHDTPRKRKAQARAIAFRGVERPEDIGEVLRRDSATGVTDHHAGEALL